MAEKISTLILKVNLDCERCYKKIRKVLCKLQDEEKINATSYDEKNNTVTISGPFDPQKLSKKLRCRAGKVIKEIQIKDNKEKEKGKEPEKDKPKDKPAAEKDKEKDKPKDKPADKEKPKETKPAKEEKPKDKPTEPAEQKPKPVEAKESQSQPKSEPGPPIQAWPAGGPPACCYRPLYEAYYGGYRCYTCGRAYGWTGPSPMGFYGGGPYDGYKGGQFFCEEDPSSSSCRVM